MIMKVSVIMFDELGPEWRVTLVVCVGLAGDASGPREGCRLRRGDGMRQARVLGGGGSEAGDRRRGDSKG